MKRFRLILLLLSVASLASGCFQQFPVRHTEVEQISIPCPSGGTLSALTTNGAIDIRSGDVEDVQIIAEKIVRSRTHEEALHFCRNTKVQAQALPAGADVQAVLPPDYHRRANIAVHIEAVVPRTCNLDLTSSNGRIEVGEIDGRVRARTSNGHVTAVRVKGDLEIRTSNGGIHGEEIVGGVLAGTSNGSIRLQRISGPAEASTSNGCISVAEIDGDVRCHTSNGSIVLQNFRAGARVDTSNGSITCELPPDASATVEGTTSNGRVRCDFPLTLRKRSVSGKIGDGKFPVHLKTSNGSLSLRRMY